MAIKITSTKDVVSNGVKALVHGPAGIGKTRLVATLKDVLLISNESGLLSLAGYDIPVIEVTTVEEINDAYEFVSGSTEAKQYNNICLDSISEMAEVMLSTYKKAEKDPRAAYGRMNDDSAITIRAFRDLKGKNVYFTAKQMRLEDTNMPTRFVPAMPGKATLNAMSFFFDEVFAMRMGQLEDGTQYRYLQTRATINFDAKDRSGKLLEKEKPDLTYIFNKIGGTVNG